MKFVNFSTQKSKICEIQAANWKLEEAIQLFYVGNEGGVPASSSLPPEVDSQSPPR